MRLAAVAIAALALAPAAGAWTTLSSGVGVTTIPSLLVTQAGTILTSFDTPNGTVQVVRNGGAPKTIVAAAPAPRRPQVVQQPNRTLQLYFPNAQGVWRMPSSDHGQT